MCDSFNNLRKVIMILWILEVTLPIFNVFKIYTRLLPIADFKEEVGVDNWIYWTN